MPVSYNIAANQRLPDPQAALKGKAIRSGIASQEKQREALQQSIDMAPDREARQQQLADAKTQEAQTKARKLAQDLTAEQLEQFLDFNAAGLAAEQREPGSGQRAFNLAAGNDSDEQVPWNPELGQALADADMDEFRMQAREKGRTAQKFIDRDGQPVQGSMDKQGNYFDSSGNQRTDITPIAPQAGQSDIAGGQAGDPVADREMMEVITGTDAMVTAVDRISEQVDEMPQSSLGLPGTITSTVDNAVNAMIGLKDVFSTADAQINGQTVPERELLDVNLYTDMFQGPAAQNAALRANAVGLSYALARAANPDGRISDADVRHQLQRVMLKGSSKTQIQSALHEVKLSILTNAANNMRRRGYTETEKGAKIYAEYMQKMDEMSPSSDEIITAPDSGPVSITNDDEFSKLPSGTVFIGPDGIPRTKP